MYITLNNCRVTFFPGTHGTFSKIYKNYMREQIYRFEFQKILLQCDGGDKNEQNGNEKGTAQS